MRIPVTSAFRGGDLYCSGIAAYSEIFQSEMLWEVDCDLYDWEAAEGESLGVLLQVNLLHGGICAGVNLQLHEVESGGGAHDHVHPSARSAYLHVHVVAQEGEYDVEHLLPAAFVVGIVGVGDSAQEGLHGLKCSVHVIFKETFRHGNKGRGSRQGVRGHVVRYQGAEQSDSHLLVGYPQCVGLDGRDAFLYSVVPALVEQRNYAGKPFCGSVEFVLACLACLS